MNREVVEDDFPMDEETFAFGSFCLIPAQRMLLEDGKPSRLGSRALDILVTLVQNAGETIHKDRLIARAWPDTVVDEGALRVHVAALRKALGDGRAGRRYIANNPGRGYTFLAPVTREHQRSAPATTDGGTAANNLPVPLTRIVGRDDIIAALATQLAQRRLLTIVGPGGIGKTTVAVAVAEAVTPAYADGVWFVGLASLADPDLVPSAVSTVLAISQSGANPVSGLAAWLRDKHALIVLDSCEHLIGAAAALAEAVLKTAPSVHILATSREPLRAESEWLHRLASLEVPPASGNLAPDDALRFSAVQLFVDRAMATVDGFSLAAADGPAALEICRKLDGVPLALELAAAQVDVFGARGIAARLDDRFAVLTKGRRTALPRHQTLRAAIDWSYDLLPELEQVILRRLAVFQGDLTMDAAAAIAIDQRITTSDVFEGVANLAAKSLVATDISSDVTYHRLLDTTRAYALEKLRESGEVERVRRQHAEYYRDLFERAEAEWEVRPTAEWLADYRLQIDNVRAALDWAFSPVGDASIGVALAAAAVPLWTQSALMEEGRRRTEEALGSLASQASPDVRREMQLLSALGAAHLLTVGTTPEAEAAWARALEIAESLGDADYRLRALWGLYVHRFTSGEYRAALAFAERFNTVAGNAADPADAVIGDRLIGGPLHMLGDQAGARPHFERALERYPAPANRRDLIRFQFDQRVASYCFLARVLWLQGFADQAMRVAQNGIDAAQAIDHPLSLFYALIQAACPVAVLAGDLAAAYRFVTILLELSDRHAMAAWNVWGQCYRGVLLAKRGDVATGLQLLRTALAGLSEAAFHMHYIFLTAELASALGRAGEAAQGLAAIDGALARSERIEEGWCVAELLRIKGEILLLQGESDAKIASEDHYRQALDRAHRQGALSWELRTATSLARLWRNRHRVAEARELLAGVYGRFTEGFDTADLQEAKSLLEQLA